MNGTNSATPAAGDSLSQNEELIKQLECLSGVLSELRRRERGSELPTWVRHGLREADEHLAFAQHALQALQAPLFRAS